MLSIQRFVKRRAESQAVEVTDGNLREVADWCGGVSVGDAVHRTVTNQFKVSNAHVILPGGMKAEVGDYVVKNRHGDFDVVKARQMNEDYEFLGWITDADTIPLF